jgi:Protein of unknown function (DUF3078)
MLKGVAILVMVSIVNWSMAQNMAVTRLRNETARNVTRVADTGYFNWKQGGAYNFNLSQSSLSNWAAGGDNFNMSISSYFNYYAYFQKPRQSWDNNFDANLGFVQSTSIGGRKNDDRIDLVSKYGYRIDTTGMWYLSALFNVRSQIFDGYSFSGTNSTFTSSFFSPAYVILSAGFDYKPNTIFSVFFSPLTSRTTLLLNTQLSNLGSYGVPKGQKIYKETGLFVTVNYNNVIAPNINYRGRADFFSNYYEKPENINFYMTNLFTFKINKNFSANYSLDLMYDDKIKSFGPNKNSPGLQLKSIIGIGYFQNLQVKKIILKPKP